jgi:hypothetical protein
VVKIGTSAKYVSCATDSQGKKGTIGRDGVKKRGAGLDCRKTAKMTAVSFRLVTPWPLRKAFRMQVHKKKRYSAVRYSSDNEF